MNDIEKRQQQTCARFGAAYKPCSLDLKVGVSRGLKHAIGPINGLRTREENGTSGWYLWVGDWSDDDDFFVPIHGRHLIEWAEIVLPYLGLPEGWRFLVTECYEDVWRDDDLSQ